ncbi:MAG: hypothetical protein QNK03_20200 [Myxococcota bacterium]|nr:hypothetical protein [Myxococcota bacterium]
MAEGVDPDTVAEHAFGAIRAGRFWILPDPGFREGFEARMRGILDALESA